jgi:hypothetical protein
MPRKCQDAKAHLRRSWAYLRPVKLSRSRIKATKKLMVHGGCCRINDALPLRRAFLFFPHPCCSPVPSKTRRYAKVWACLASRKRSPTLERALPSLFAQWLDPLISSRFPSFCDRSGNSSRPYYQLLHTHLCAAFLPTLFLCEGDEDQPKQLIKESETRQDITGKLREPAP